MSQGQGRNEVSSVLDKLDKYVETHFAHEEDCMVKYHCSVAAANIAHEPQLLLVADMGKVPDQRRHQRRVLADQIVVVDGICQQLATVAGCGEHLCDACTPLFS